MTVKALGSYRLLAVVASVVPLLLSTACGLVEDIPKHDAEEIISIARAFSPQCKLQVGEERHG